MYFKESVELGGRTFTLETGRLAKQAHGAVWVEYGDSRVLACATTSSHEREGIDFFPLTVDYQEKMASVGRFPGGFIKREARPQLREVLTSRLIDRPIRPLFPKGYKREVQIVATVLSADMENDTDLMAMTGTSAALHISSIPFEQPICGLRVGYIDGEYVCNPTPEQMENSRCDIFVATTKEAIVMVEGKLDELTEDETIDALMKAHEWAQPVIELQERMREAVGKEKIEFTPPEQDEEIFAKVKELAMPKLEASFAIQDDKLAHYAATSEAKKFVVEQLKETVEEEKQFQIGAAFEKIVHDYARELILSKKQHLDGRALDEVRPISIETGVLPRVHGSAVFQRGETQALVSVTLGTESDAQRVDDMLGDRTENFLLHYNFPPYSVGETKRMGSPGRRELGHGNLAMRALKPMVPTAEDGFQYSVRIVSEILESNGSSSMASVCGGCLAMMDAGVKIKKPVAGVAMGLIEEGDEIAILTDILGEEDHSGDMDFKVCGTQDGITALQMDLKMNGVTRELLTNALAQAKQGRLHILEKMLEHIPAPREEYSPYAPRIVTIKINPDRIRDIIGSKGKTIREITEQTGCQINVEDDGTVSIASANEDNCNMAIEIIKGLTEEPEVGKVYKGRVKNITSFGAFVEIIPGIEGLLHISEIAHKRIASVEDYLSEGDEIDVKLLDVERNGKLRLSMKALLPKPEGTEDDDNHGGGGRGGGRGGRGGGNRR